MNHSQYVFGPSCKAPKWDGRKRMCLRVGDGSIRACTVCACSGAGCRMMRKRRGGGVGKPWETWETRGNTHPLYTPPPCPLTLALLVLPWQALMLLLIKGNTRLVMVPGHAGKPPVLAEAFIHNVRLDTPGEEQNNSRSLRPRACPGRSHNPTNGAREGCSIPGFSLRGHESKIRTTQMTTYLMCAWTVHRTFMCGTATVGANVLALLGCYVIFISVGFIFLRHLYKERR